MMWWDMEYHMLTVLDPLAAQHLNNRLYLKWGRQATTEFQIGLPAMLMQVLIMFIKKGQKTITWLISILKLKQYYSFLSSNTNSLSWCFPSFSFFVKTISEKLRPEKLDLNCRAISFRCLSKIVRQIYFNIHPWKSTPFATSKSIEKSSCSW